MNETGNQQETKMTVEDYGQFSEKLALFYTSFFSVSKEAADAIHTLWSATRDVLFYETGESYRDEEGHLIPEKDERSHTDVITEEILREKGYDLVVNQTLEALHKEIETGKIKPGTVQYTTANYVIDSLDDLRRREYIGSDWNKEKKYFPGFRISQKIANYNLMPKLEGFKKVKVGDEITYEFPEGYAEDEERFHVRQDLVEGKGKHTREEMDEAAERVNYDGFTSATAEYMKVLRQLDNMIGVQPPETQEQEEILRESLRTAAQRLKMEVEAAQATDPDDPVALRFFDDSKDQLLDSMTKDPKNGRSMTRDMARVDEYLGYLDSGLPLAGYPDYLELIDVAGELEREAVSYREKPIHGLDNLKEKSHKLQEKLKAIPRDPAQTQQWLSEVRSGFEDCIRTYEAIPEKERDETLKSRFDKLTKETLPMMDHLGDKNIGIKRRHTMEIVEGMSKDMTTITGELKEVSDSSGDLSQDLSEAINRAVEAGDPTHTDGPRKYLEELDQVYEEAKKTNKTELMEFVSKNRAYFANRLEQAKGRGVMEDASLDLQREVMELRMRAQGIQKGETAKTPLQQALDRFHTKRAGIFSRESEEHKQLGTETFKLSKNMEIFDKDLNAVYENHEKMMKLKKGFTSELAKKYMGLKSERDALKKESKRIESLMTGLELQNRTTSERTERFEELEKQIEEYQVKMDDLKKEYVSEQDKKDFSALEEYESLERYRDRRVESLKTTKGVIELQVEVVKKSAKNYLDKKSQNPYTSAGKERRQGAEDILKETDSINQRLAHLSDLIELVIGDKGDKQREIAEKQYDEISKNTEKMKAANQKREAELKEREQRIQEQRKKEEAEAIKKFREIRNDLKKQRDEVENEKRSKEAPVGTGKKMNLDELAEKKGMNIPERERNTVHQSKGKKSTKQNEKVNEQVEEQEKEP